MAVGKILVVDDDPNLIELVKMRLESAGYDVTAAIKEEDAIGAVRSEPVDLCLLDLMLENRDGISLMEEVHAITPDRKSTRLNSSHLNESRMPSSA